MNASKTHSCKCDNTVGTHCLVKLGCGQYCSALTYSLMAYDWLINHEVNDLALTFELVKILWKPK